MNLATDLLLSAHFCDLPCLSLFPLEKVISVIIISRVPHGFTASPMSPQTNRLAAAGFPRVHEEENATDLFCLPGSSHTMFVGTYSLNLHAKITSSVHVMYFPRLCSSRRFQFHICSLELMNV